MKIARIVIALLLWVVSFNAAADVPANSQWYVRWREAPVGLPTITQSAPVVPGGVTPFGQYAVVPLDFQKGNDISGRTQNIGGQGQWLDVHFPYIDSAGYHPTVELNGTQWDLEYFPARFPIAAFGSATGGTPLYVGQSYRFALVGGSQTEFTDSSDELQIAVINKTTGQVVTVQYIDLPSIAAATASGDGQAWEAFGDQGYQKTFSAVVGGNTVLETKIQYVASGIDWAQWGAVPSPFNNATTFPIFITHKAMNSQYGIVVSCKQGLVVSGSAFPWSYENLVAYPSTFIVDGHEAMYAMAFEDLPAWGTTLLETPHFQGKPLPSFYQGKTVEEIEEGAPEVDWNFGSLFEGIKWVSMTNLTSSGGGTGGTELTKTTPNGWDSGAGGEKVIYGDGQIQFRFKPSIDGLIGLDANGEHVEYALFAQTVDNKVHIFANGSEEGATPVTYTEADVFTLERQGVLVRALKNGEPFHTFATPSFGKLGVYAGSYTQGPFLLSCRYRGAVLADSDNDSMEDVWEQRLADFKPDDSITTIASILAGEDFDGDGVSNVQEYRDGTDAANALSTLDLQTVVWTGHVNATNQGTAGGLKKTSGANATYDAGAISTRRIIADGKVTFKAVGGGYLVVGLNTFSQAQDLAEMDFAIRLENTGAASIYESNVLKAAIGAWTTGTVFEIRRTGDVITYHKDGGQVYVSSAKSTGALLVDTAFYNSNSELTECRIMTGDKDADGMLDTWELALLPPGATLQDLQNFLPSGDLDGDGQSNLREYQAGTDPKSEFSRMEPITWTSFVNTAAVAGNLGGLQKSAGGTNYNADAVSNKKITGNGKLVFKGALGGHFLVGLDASNGGQGHQDLDYAIHLQTVNGIAVTIYEAGTYLGTFSTTWNADSVFEIRRTNGVVTYHIDGAQVYQSATKSFKPLQVDTAIYTQGSTIAECAIQTGDLDGDQMPDSAELAALAPGASYQDLQNFLPTADLDGDGVTNLQESNEGTNLANAVSRSEAVTWTSHVNTVSVAGGLGGLQKNAGGNNIYNADAVSNKKILGDGKVIFKGVAGSHFLVGLNPVNVDRSHGDLDYAIHPTTVGGVTVSVYESGPQVFNPGVGWTASSVFEIRRVGTTVTYHIDGVQIYQSAVKSYGPLLVDTAFYTQGSTIAECRIVSGDIDGDGMADSFELAALPANATLTDLQNFLPTADLDSDGRSNLEEYQDGTGVNNATSKLEPIVWTAHRNTQSVGALGGLQKHTGVAIGWDADAVSTKVIAGDGRARFRFAQINKHLMVGLSSNNVEAGFPDLEYALYGANNATLHVYEGGVSRGSFGNYAATDVFEIRRDGATVTYWKNGLAFYTSTVPSTGPMMVEGNFYDLTAALTDASYSNTSAPTTTPIQLGATTTDLLTLDTSPELRTHPTLDALVEDLGRNPMALANFVLNEIELTDAIAYNDRGEFEEASVNDGGVNRNALGVYLERQGSPTEQCALLVYLLRRAGYPTTYVFPATNTVKVLDTTLSKMLRMQISGALKADGTSDVPHEVPVNYPWVAAYVDGEWIHLFPWMKDTEVVEGRDVWSHIKNDPNKLETEWVNSPLRWTRNYLEMREPAYDTLAAKESPLETFKRKFQDQLNAEATGLKVEDFGYRYIERKHNHARWEDFPKPWSVDPMSSPTTYPTFRARGEIKWGFADGQWDKMFDTVTITISGQPVLSPGTISLVNAGAKTITFGSLSGFAVGQTIQEADANGQVIFGGGSGVISAVAGNTITLTTWPTQGFNVGNKIRRDGTALANLGPLRLSDLHNRRAIFKSNGSQATFWLQELRPGAAGTGTFLSTASLTAQQLVTITDSTNTSFTFTAATQRHRGVTPPAGSVDTFLGVGELIDQRTMSIPRWDIAAWCLNAGRVTSQMLRVHAEESWALNQQTANQANSDKMREIVAYIMGMSYHQRISESWKGMTGLCKLSHISTRAFGFGTIGDKFDGVTHTPAFPSLDMFYSRTAYAGGDSLRPDAGGQSKVISAEFPAFAIAEISAVEHLTINRFFPEEETDAISTVNLLHRAKARPAPSNFFREFSSANFTTSDFGVAAGSELITFTNPKTSAVTQKTLREWAGGQWTSIENAFAPGKPDREFVRVFITPGPISGAKNDWSGVGTLIVGQGEGAALIGQSKNGAAGKSLTILGELAIQGGAITFADDGKAKYGAFLVPSPSTPSYAPASTPYYNYPTITSGYSSGGFVPTLTLEKSLLQAAGNYASGTTFNVVDTIVDTIQYGNLGNPRLPDVVEQAIADPVNTLTGEFYVDSVDLALAGPMRLEIRRNYSSRNLSENSFGYGWMLSMMPFLQLNEDGTIQAAEMDGNVIKYTQVSGNPNKWEVSWDSNPELMNTSNGRLHFNYIEKSVESGNTIYRLKGHQGSIREYVVRSFPIPNSTITRSRPYLKRWYDHAGNYFEFSFYDVSGTSEYGQLRRIASSSGQAIVFYYDASGRVNEIATADGRRVKYAYNTQGDLTEVVRPDGSKETYEYALQQETPPNSSTPKWVSTHLIVREVKPGGRIIKNEYEKNPNGTYADSRRVLKQFSNVGRPVSLPSVPSLDQPVSASEANEPVAESYEPRLSARFNYSNLVETTIPNTTSKKRTGYVEVFNAYDRKVVYHYVDNHLTKVVDHLGYTSSTEYFPDTASQTDPGGYRRSVKRTVDRRGLITDYKYDANGNAVETAVTGDLDGNPLTTETAVFTSQFNSLNLPWRSVAPNPTTGAASGLVTEITYGHPTDPYLPTETKILSGTTVLTKTLTEYVSMGNSQVPFANALVSKTSTGIDGDMAVTVRSYNRFGLPESQTQYSGVPGVPDIYTRFRHNFRHELEEVTDVAGRKTVYSYDDMGRRIWEERLDETGKQLSWSYVYYNQNGEVEWTDGPRYAPEDYTYARYDGMGRVVEQVMWRSRAKADGKGVEEVPGAELYATSKKAYSLFGDLVKTTDPHGNTTRMKYDEIGRPTESHAYQGDWQNGGTVLASTYNTYHSELDGNNIPRDKAVTVKGPTGGLTKTYHTQAGKPWKQENSDGTVLGWEYYLDGRPKKEPLSPHTYVLYTYDDAARQVTKTVKNATGSTLGQPQVTTANSRGQIISATDAAGYQVTTTHDKLGRPLQVTQPHTPGTPNPVLALGRIYDAAGIVATTYNALNEKTVTTHDALGRPILAQILAANGTVVSQTSTDYEPSLPGETAKIKGHNATQTTSGVGGEAIKSSVVLTDTAGTAVLEAKQLGGYVRTEHDMVANVTKTYVAGNLDGAGDPNVLDITVTSVSYDGLGRPLITTMPDGAKVTMFYDYVRDGGNNIIGSVVERRMPGAAGSLAQAPTEGGLVEYQKFDAAGRLMEKSLRSENSSTRNYTYHYHPSNAGKDAGLLHYFEQQVTTSSSRQHVYTYDDWRRTDTYTCGTVGQSDYVKNTFTYGDPRGLVTALREDTVAGYTIVNRVYDEQGRVSDEKVNVDGTVARHLTNGYNAAGRRDSLAIGNAVSRLGNSAGGSYAFGWQANGKLKTVTTAGQTFNYGYQTTGLVSSRTNPWRSYSVTSRDTRGRLTGATTHLAGVTGAVLAEGLTWLGDNRQASYTAQRGVLPGDPIAAWTDDRDYTYDLGRRRLTNETFTPSQGGATNLVYGYDQGHAGLGVRTSATQGEEPIASDFQSFVGESDTDATNAFARVLRENVNHSARDFNAQGTALGAQKVILSLAHSNSQSSRVPLRVVTHPGPSDNQGAWNAPLRLWPGGYTLHAAAEHPSGTFTDTSESSFTLQREMLSIHNTYDEEGNATGRTWKAGATTVRTQTLTWDGKGRLINAVDRDSNGHGYDWSARYDGLGRRVGTLTQTVRSNAGLGAAFEEGSWYDPLVEFLEIAVETRQVGVANSERRTWKVHGPDANGAYGGLQGIGGLEALVEETDGAVTALVDDHYGHVIAHMEAATMTARWSVTRCQSYGPTPDSPVFSLNSGATLAQTIAWRGRRADVTGFYHLGARYYEATSGRFMSPDPLGHGASMDLYSFAGGDPVNFVDPTGRYQTSARDMSAWAHDSGDTSAWVDDSSWLYDSTSWTHDSSWANDPTSSTHVSSWVSNTVHQYNSTPSPINIHGTVNTGESQFETTSSTFYDDGTFSSTFHLVDWASEELSIDRPQPQKVSAPSGASNRLRNFANAAVKLSDPFGITDKIFWAYNNNNWVPHGFGIVGQGSATASQPFDIPLLQFENHVEGAAGFGGFQAKDGQVNFGSFASWGGEFSRNGETTWEYPPKPKNGPVVENQSAGLYAGLGLSGLITNARSVQEYGSTEVAISANLDVWIQIGGFSFSLSPDGKIWALTISPPLLGGGGGADLSIQRGRTETTR